MREAGVVDLADCTVFRQALQARPPRLIHGTALLLAVLLGTGFVWAAVTEANLVVRAQGIVRPVDMAQAVKTRFGGRVVKVYFRDGQQVRRDDVLLQLDTAKVDNDILKRELTIRTAQKELEGLVSLQARAVRQSEAARAKAQAELAQGEQEVRLAKERHAVDIRLAEVERGQARDELNRSLRAGQGVSESERVKAEARLREAEEKLARAQLPVEDSRVEVLRRALVLLDQEDAVRREELEMKRAAKQGEIEAAEKDLMHLHWERNEATIRCPINGVVLSGDWKEDDILEPGKMVAEVAVQKGFLFEAYVPSEESGHVEETMPARIKLDPFDFQKYGTLEGSVCFLAKDSKTVEQRGVFYTVRIELKVDEVGQGEHRGWIKLGMTGRAEIVTGQESVLSLLVRKVRRTISLG